MAEPNFLQRLKKLDGNQLFLYWLIASVIAFLLSSKGILK